MTATEYDAERLRDQIGLYDRSANRKRKQHYVLALAAIVASGAVPVSLAVGWPPSLAGLAGGIATILLSVHGLLGPQEDWIRYRDTSERLKKLQYFYRTRTGPFHGLEGEELTQELVQMTEDTVSRETQVWAEEREKKEAKLPQRSK